MINTNQRYTRDRAWNEFLDGLSRLYNPDKILREKGLDISIYKHLTYDSHVDSCLTSREAGLLSSEFDIVPADTDADSRKIADFVRANLLNNHDIDLFSLIRYAQECIYFGYGVYEDCLRKDGSNLIYDKIVGLPPEWFAFGEDNRLLFLSKNNYNGEPVDDECTTLVQYRASYKNPYGEGKFSRIFYPTTLKKAFFKFGAQFAEKFGSVILYIATKSQDDGKTKKLLDMLYNMAQDSVGVIETTDELKTLPIDKSGSADLYINFISMCNAEISKALLGQTLTTETGGTGSYALGKVHFDVRADIVEHDKKFTAQVINRLIRKLVDINFSGIKQYPQLKYFEEDASNKEIADRDNVLYGMGVRFSKEYIASKYRIDINQIEIAENDTMPFSELKKKL